MTIRSRAKIAAALLALGVTDFASAAQGMDEVWFPGRTIAWGHTQTTADILHGICDAVSVFTTRTPVEMPEQPNISRSGGLDQPSELGLLEIRYSEGIFNYGYGGQTKHYRRPDVGKKVLKLSFENVKTRAAARLTTAHELGHVLGFTHEFQRWDRKDNGVSVGGFAGRDPYNFGRPDRKNLRVLSPYDLQSRFATGYSAVSPPHNGPPGTTLLSAHDINAIYRVYGRSLGANTDGLRFGEAAVSADFDGDGFDDIAIAARHNPPPDNNASVYFFRGVAQAPEEEGTGTTYLPWFREDVALGPDDGHRIVLAAGDSHTLTNATTPAPDPDGIAELYVGLPGADRVEIWVVNAVQKYRGQRMLCDGASIDVVDDSQPWGGHGVAVKIPIDAADVGAAAGSGFGAALAVGRLFGGDGDDLAIGAPEGVASLKPQTGAAGADRRPDARFRTRSSMAPVGAGHDPAVYLLPDGDPAQALQLSDPRGEAASEFGAALAVLRDFDTRQDTLAVGAPGASVSSLTGHGRVYVFRRPVFSRVTDSFQLPELSGEFPAPGTVVRNDPDNAARHGTALVAFSTREEGEDTAHWLAWGAPDATLGAVRCGEVRLYRVKLREHPEHEHGISPSPCEAGMGFGKALAVAQGVCSDALCPKQRAWVAVGSPQQRIDAVERGAVHLWDVWTGDDVNPRAMQRWDGPNADSLWGSRIAAVRAHEKGGGFIVLARRGEALMPGNRPGELRAIESGLASVRLNTQGHSEWTSWVRTLTPGTGPDTPPANR